MSTREAVLSGLLLSEVINSYVPLTRKGNEFEACCPFHEEKTPSFTVNDTKGFYHCFGCKAHGNAIDFVIEYEKVSYPDALKKLAEMGEIPFSLQLQRQNQGYQEQLDLKPVYQQLVTGFHHFRRQLKGHLPTHHPFHQIPNNTLDNVHAGWAPDVSSLMTFWQTRFQTREHNLALQKIGLIGKRSPDHKMMLPVYDNQKQCRGLYAVGVNNHATWYSHQRYALPLCSPSVLSADYQVRKTGELWVTDDIATWMKMVADGRLAVAIPYPANKVCHLRAQRGLLAQWSRVNVALTHETAYLYDHPLLVELLQRYSSTQQIKMMEAAPGNLPDPAQLKRLIDYLVGRSCQDAGHEYQAAGDRIIRLTRHWLELMPDQSLAKYVCQSHVKKVAGQITSTREGLPTIIHPLAMTQDLQTLLLNASRHPDTVTRVPNNLAGVGLLEKVMSNQTLNPQEKAWLNALNRQFKSKGMKGINSKKSPHSTVRTEETGVKPGNHKRHSAPQL